MQHIQLACAAAATRTAGINAGVPDENVKPKKGQIFLSTMHRAKGLEFKAVVVMVCEDEVVPLQARTEAVGDDADLQEVYETEQHLLYVACIRARDYLYISAAEPASEFLEDLAE